MKDIVVAVDFSDASINAFKHAITIANRAKKNILMVWVAKHGSGEVIEEPHDIIERAEQKFQKIINDFKPTLEGIEVQYKIRAGKVFREIIDEAVERNAALIFTGTHGMSGFEQFWIGSNAMRIIANAPCPIITIREGTNVEKDLEKIVMPIDSTVESRQKVPITTEIASLFGAEVHILALYSTHVAAVQSMVEGYCDHAEEYLKEHGVSYVRTSVYADNLADAVLNYAEQIGANLVSIMNEQETKASNFWLGSYTSQAVNQATIPVLVVKAK